MVRMNIMDFDQFKKTNMKKEKFGFLEIWEFSNLLNFGNSGNLARL